MVILKQSTAVDVLIGPFVDSTDGYTAKTAVSPSVKLSKNGQTLAAKSDVTTPVHDADGYFNCELDATDTNTVGVLVLTVVGSATSLPVRHEFQVVEEVTYDALFGASATGFNASGQVAVASIAANAVSASALATDAVTEIQSGLATATALATVDTVVDAVKVQTDKLTFTVANQVDSNIQYVNDVAVTGNGSTGTEWGPSP